MVSFQDKKADLLIHTYVDDIMSLLMAELGLVIPDYNPKLDPSKRDPPDTIFEWTIPESEVKRMRSLYEQNCCKAKKKIKVKSEPRIDTKLIKKEANESDEEREIKRFKPGMETNPINCDLIKIGSF